MRKDPPVDADYLHDTQILGLAQRAGALVVNDPQGLRDLNEKLAALRIPAVLPADAGRRATPPRSRPSSPNTGEAVLKPLDGMGGRSIFRVARRRAEPQRDPGDPDRRAAATWRWRSATCRRSRRATSASCWSTASRCDYCLARIPQGDEFRGNLAAGGRGEGRR